MAKQILDSWRRVHAPATINVKIEAKTRPIFASCITVYKWKKGQKPTPVDSGCVAGLSPGSSWTPSNGPWSVHTSERCAIVVEVLKKGDTADMTVLIDGENYGPYSYTADDEPRAARFKLSAVQKTKRSVIR